MFVVYQSSLIFVAEIYHSKDRLDFSVENYQGKSKNSIKSERSTGKSEQSQNTIAPD